MSSLGRAGVSGGNNSSSSTASTTNSRARWMSFGVGLLVNACGGTPFMFGAFEQKLKARYGYSETESLLLASCAVVGLYAGLLQGLCFDAYGPQRGILLATACLAGGYAMAYHVSSMASPPPVSIFALAFFLIGNGSHGFYTCGTMTNVPNFERSAQGRALGALASAFGLAGALFSQISGAFDWGVIEDDETTTLTSTTTTITTITTAAAADAAADAADAAVNERVMVTGSGVSAEVITTTVAEAAVHHHHQTPLNFFLFCAVLMSCVGALGYFFLRRLPPPDSGSNSSSRSSKNRSIIVKKNTTTDTTTTTTATNTNTTTNNAGSATSSGGSNSGPIIGDITGWQLLRHGLFQKLFVVMALEDGAAIVFMQSLGAMRKALGQSESSAVLPPATTLIMAVHLSNAVSRLSWGAASDAAVRRGYARSYVLTATMTGMLLTFAILYIYPRGLLFGAILVGCFFGGVFALVPAITVELFGTSHFGTNWGLLVLAPGASTGVLGYLFGRMFDTEAKRQGNENSECIGVNCYRDAFLLVAITLSVGVVVAWRLAVEHARRSTAVVQKAKSPIKL